MTSAGADAGRGGDVGARLAAYRQVREEIEVSVLPLATSVDGNGFELQASLHDLDLRRGGYVILESGEGSRLGQVTDVHMEVMDPGESPALGSNVRIRLARGVGTVLEGDGRPFHDARVRPATSEEVAGWVTRNASARAGLVVGELLLAPGVPATLDSGGFGRHTFLCGQSGSGKTYSLGLLLERVLSETELRVVVLDPNSDHVALPRVREGADPALAERYAHVPSEVSVWRNEPSSPHPLTLRFADLDSTTQAAVLGLDPIRDREEYAALTDLLRVREDGKPLVSGIDELLHAESAGARQLGQRAGNLGVLDWSVWSPDRPSLIDELLEPSTRCTVVDLGSLDTMQEQRLVAAAVLSTLWDSRLARTPCLVVMDEAHNICPQEPSDPLSRIATDRAVQIAAEGRKYGLYLLTSTQRPHKVHDEVVSQCDNLVLMRMNSQADLEDLARVFSFVPEGLVRGATTFAMGQALVAGKIVDRPAYVRMGARVSEEGGADIPAAWATRRAQAPRRLDGSEGPMEGAPHG
jgi:uncharacterized protein